jgi:ferredoxin-NADP reductase
MGKGFPLEKVPPKDFDTMLIFATGSGISPIKALIDAGDLDATERANVTLFYGAHDPASMAYMSRCERILSHCRGVPTMFIKHCLCGAKRMKDWDVWPRPLR